MAYAARGSQVPFTSINMEFTVPEFLQDEPAYGPKGKLMGVYGDFEDETRALQRAFTEILLGGMLMVNHTSSPTPSMFSGMKCSRMSSLKT